MKTHDGEVIGSNTFLEAKEHEGQFNYLGRWVDKHTFRAFVYSDKGDEKLANSYQEFISLTTSGLWYASKPNAPKDRKPKHGTPSPNSK